MINFEGIYSNDLLQIKKFTRYLEGKEHQLAIHILKQFSLKVEEFSKYRSLKLSDIFDKISAEIQSFDAKSKQEKQKINKLKNFINAELWNYIGILESCNNELFQQLEFLPFDKWKTELFTTVESVKAFLMQRLDNLSWGVKRLEDLLWEYKFKNDKSLIDLVLRKISFFSLVDRSISINIQKNKKFLNYNYEKYNERFKDYKIFDVKMNEVNQKFEKYLILNTLDLNDQKCLKEIYKYIKLWEYNKTRQTIPESAIISALRNIQGQKKNYQAFYDYYNALKNAMFHNARVFKLGADGALWEDEMGRSIAGNLIATNRSEINTLGITVQKFKDFLLRTDPNPYVRSKLSFSDWSGQEPPYVKRLSSLIYEIENLHTLYERLCKAIQIGKDPLDRKKMLHAKDVIEKHLHEMEQPLISESLMKDHVEKILYILNDLNELGSFDTNIVPFTENVLSKLLRVDWKYNTAYEISLFKELYEIHKGLIGKSKDRMHFSRVNKIKQNLHEIESWSKDGSLDKHVSEVENDISDLKAILQDILNTFKRKKSKALVDSAFVEESNKEMQQQLLEYRYLFGKFLHELSITDVDKEQLRHQFIFIHQYLEAIEGVLD